MKRVIEQNTEWINSTWEKTEKKLARLAVKSRDKIPYTTIDGVHDDWSGNDKINWWTNGFWGGMMWLAYKETGNEEYKKTAVRSEELMDKALASFKELHHDVGFMWHLLSGAHYRICADEGAYNRNLFAAATLFSRFNVDGNYIRAWNDCGDEDHTGWSIIDCMMNIPLLYWASEEIGDERFKKVAMHHADMVLHDHIREDGSVNHIVEHDPATGEVTRVYAGQGYSETSCWSRGSAWAIYGLILSYIHTGKKEYLDACVKCANYFIINCMKDDYRAVADFRAPEEPIYYDSTASVCAACGIIELSKYVSEKEGEIYLGAAINILKAVDKYFADYSEAEDAIVKMGTERYPKNDAEMAGVHIPIIYGDFFYVEALLKLRGSDFLIW